MKARGFESNNRLFERGLAREDFGETRGRIESEVVGGARVPEVAVNQERAHAVGLREKPGEVDGRQGLAFHDACARDDEGLHLLSLARVQDARAQTSEALGVAGARLRDGDEVWFDARGGDV